MKNMTMVNEHLVNSAKYIDRYKAIEIFEKSGELLYELGFQLSTH